MSGGVLEDRRSCSCSSSDRSSGDDLPLFGAQAVPLCTVSGQVARPSMRPFSPVLQFISTCVFNSEGVQATFLVAPGLSAMLFRLT